MYNILQADWPRKTYVIMEVWNLADEEPKLSGAICFPPLCLTQYSLDIGGYQGSMITRFSTCLCLRSLDWTETYEWLVAINGEHSLRKNTRPREGVGQHWGQVWELRGNHCTMGRDLYVAQRDLWLICIAQDFSVVQLPALHPPCI